MIRVLHVSTPSGWRGGEQQVYNLVLMQQQSEDVVPLILCPEDSELSLRLAGDQLSVFNFQSAGILQLNLAGQIVRIVRQQKIDLVHTHDSHAHSAAIMSASFFGMKKPVVVHRRVDFPVSSNPFSHWKYNHPSVKNIICVSQKISEVTAPAIRNREKLSVVYSGIDLSRYAHVPNQNVIRKELSIPDDVKLIGNLSALADHKDYPVFLRTAELLLKEGHRMRFIIAGEGPEEDNLRNKIQERRLEKNVIMLGFRNDIKEVMQSLDVFLMTSKTEGLGTILIEAFAAGVPVVATDAGGIPELVKNEETGLLCKVGDTKALAAAVVRLCSNPELRQKITSGARNFAGKFSRIQTAAEILRIYRSILNES